MGAPTDGSGAPISPQAARRIVLEQVLAVGAVPVALEDCLGRVTAREVTSTISGPPFASSAMDGYALRSAETAGEARPLRIVDESRAGHPATRGPEAGEAVRISTGAMIPPGADAVLALEDAFEEGGCVRPERPVAESENVRFAGEDFREGDLLLAAGRVLSPPALGLLAAAGVQRVQCARRPAVAIFTSGDELVPVGRPLREGQIYDSNAHSLRALAQAAGAEVVSGGALPDNRAAIREAMGAQLSCDVVLVSGGVSVGHHDHVKGALADLGVQERFWRVALRPGAPTWFGTIAATAQRRPTLVFGLPGNPVSSMVTFRLFAAPALRAMSGLAPEEPPVSAALATAYRKPAGRAHYLRCRLQMTHDGWKAHLTREEQGSHVLSSMVDADALAVIPAERDHVAEGERVQLVML